MGVRMASHGCYQLLWTPILHSRVQLNCTPKRNRLKTTPTHLRPHQTQTQEHVKGHKNAQKRTKTQQSFAPIVRLPTSPASCLPSCCMYENSIFTSANVRSNILEDLHRFQDKRTRMYNTSTEYDIYVLRILLYDYSYLSGIRVHFVVILTCNKYYYSYPPTGTELELESVARAEQRLTRGIPYSVFRPLEQCTEVLASVGAVSLKVNFVVSSIQQQYCCSGAHSSSFLWDNGVQK